LPIATKRVVVSFDDHFIPFECLIKDPRTNNSFLLRDHVFLYVYSADFLLRESVNDELDNSVMGVAPVLYQPGSNLSPLKGAEESLKSILKNFSESFSLTRESATKQSFLESFPKYAIVHVYSHAMADHTDEPRLYFHDQPVMMKDLQVLPEVKTQLMVLSGCQTGVGKSIKGEGVLSLARAFAAAGIPSTITTLWSVDDRVTYRLMENFYRHLHLGIASDEALQQAKLDFLEQYDGENELPYYWASTVALGQSMQMEKQRPDIGNVGLTVLVLAAIASGGVFFLRRKILLL
jgi:CHAT domain-containing protein